MPLMDHGPILPERFAAIRYEARPARGAEGGGLAHAWIWLDNEPELNALTTRMIQEIALAVRAASADRRVQAIVLTGAGTRGFCAGGNTREYVESYVGRPEEYQQYMRLFADMIFAILHCDKPVVCRVNGVRVGGGNEIGLACDFSVAQDLARFGQAGPRHGSAPIAGATQMLPLCLGTEGAMQAAVLCDPMSAYKALRLGLVTEVVPALRVDGALVRNPLVETERHVEDGRIVFGEPLAGDRLAAGRALLARGTVDLAPLDEAVERLLGKLLATFPACTMRTIQSIRAHKLAAFQRDAEEARAWLAQNMMTEARAGFLAFERGAGGRREVDFVELRRRLARGEAWSDELVAAILPPGAKP